MPTSKKTTRATKSKTRSGDRKTRTAKKGTAKLATRTAGAAAAKNKAPVRAAAAKSHAPKGGRDDAFWALIARVESKSGGKLTAAREAFRTELESLGDDELRAAVVAFNDAMRRAHNFDVWGAAYLIHGGCSDDGFWDFRAGLVALGHDVYEKALKEPDSLADIADVETRTVFEGFQYQPRKVLEARGLTVETPGQHAKPVTGKGWDDDAELETRYPRLAERFA